MNSFSVAYAKAHLSELLTQVEAGEEIAITRHGKTIAKLSPAKKPSRGLDFETLRKVRQSYPPLREPSIHMLMQMRNEE